MPPSSYFTTLTPRLCTSRCPTCWDRLTAPRRFRRVRHLGHLGHLGRRLAAAEANHQHLGRRHYHRRTDRPVEAMLGVNLRRLMRLAATATALMTKGIKVEVEVTVRVTSLDLDLDNVTLAAVPMTLAEDRPPTPNLFSSYFAM